MPLQRFIPSSSDRYISNDKNQGAVKFGHLNAVVDYINSSVIPDGLQLEGDGPLTSTPRYITDNSGNLSSLAISSGNIGIGTNSPSEKFVIQNDNGGAAFIVQANSYAYASIKRFSNNGTRARYETYKARGTIQSPISINTSDEIGSVDFYGYDGSNFQRNAIIFCKAENVSGGVITPSLKFGVGTTAPNNQYRLSIFNNGNVSIGQDSDGNSRLSIKGSGSTSATTSLLVQNSAGSTALQILDDGTINTSSTAAVNVKFLLNVTYDITCRGISANSQSTNGTLTLAGKSQGNAGGTMVNILYAGSPAGTTGTSLKISEAPLQGGTHIGIDVNGNYTSSIGSNTLIGYSFNPTNTSSFSTIRAFQSAVGGVYINTTSYNASAILQADSTTQGFLPPRMTTAEKLAIATPASGLQVYDSTLNQMSYYNGSSWINF